MIQNVPDIGRVIVPTFPTKQTATVKQRDPWLKHAVLFTGAFTFETDTGKWGIQVGFELVDGIGADYQTTPDWDTGEDALTYLNSLYSFIPLPDGTSSFGEGFNFSLRPKLSCIDKG
jgi:hypothetical protein